MKPSARASAVAVLACTVAAGCSFGESGVPPPLDGLFLPTGLAVDPTGDWLYVVNSNSDLRYNAGTVAAVDARTAAEDRARRDWGACPSAGYRPEGPSGTRTCCADFHDPVTLNCDERGYIAAGATVRIGSFGSTVVVGGGANGGPDRRLFVAVRAEPSVTFIDARLNGPQIDLRCQAGTGGGANPLCDETHKVRSGTDALGTFRLPEEPYSLALDERLGVLYVSHGAYGVSLIDTCAPEQPTLVSVTWPAFAQERCTNRDLLRCQAVNGLVLGEPGNPAGPVYAMGRYVTGEPAEVQTLFLRGAEQPCGGASARAMDLVPGSSFFPSAFFPYGMDIRGFVLAPDQQRAYVLHRNGSPLYARDNPPALVAVDRSPDAQGRPVNRAVEVVEICSGATELHWHDAGRGPRLYVVCFESGQIYVVDPELMEVSAVINAGRGPTTMAFAPRDPTVAYLAGFSDNNVSVIDLKPGSSTEHKVVQRIGFPTLRR
jgi:DNA-binding beta-propeller fold protein YncE